MVKKKDDTLAIILSDVVQNNLLIDEEFKKKKLLLEDIGNKAVKLGLINKISWKFGKESCMQSLLELLEYADSLRGKDAT